MNTEQIRRYFLRLGLAMPETIVPDAALLHKLHYTHSTIIPYENTQFLKNQLIRLDEKSLYEHIVINGMGGICLDLNGSFMGLLKGLGYSVESIMVYMSQNDGWNTEYPHEVLIASDHSGAKWWCDVGDVIGMQREPLPFVFGIEQFSNGERIRLTQNDAEIFFECFRKGEWQKRYKYDGLHLNVEKKNCIKQLSAEKISIFSSSNILSLKTAGGCRTLFGNRYRESVNGELFSKDCTVEDYPALYRKFNLTYENYFSDFQPGQ